MTAQTPVTSSQIQAARAGGSFFAPLQREFDRLFDQLGAGWNIAASQASPRMDVRETDDAIEVTMEVPGMAQDDVKVTFEDGVLSVRGEKKASSEKTEGDYHVSERSFGSFSRAVRLPTNVDGDKVAATLKDGILTLTAPKSGDAKAKTIAIQVQ